MFLVKNIAKLCRRKKKEEDHQHLNRILIFFLLTLCNLYDIFVSTSRSLALKKQKNYNNT